MKLQPEVDDAIPEARLNHGLLRISQVLPRSQPECHPWTAEVGANLAHELPSLQLLRRPPAGHSSYPPPVVEIGWGGVRLDLCLGTDGYWTVYVKHHYLGMAVAPLHERFRRRTKSVDSV